MLAISSTLLAVTAVVPVGPELSVLLAQPVDINATALATTPATNHSRPLMTGTLRPHTKNLQHLCSCETLSGMTTRESPTLLRHMWKTTLLSGILSVILGVLVLLLPGASVFVAAVLLAAYLLVSGITMVVFAFSLHVSLGQRIWLFISGAASVILAVLAFLNFYNAVWLLAIWIGVGFIFRGVSTTISAISEPDIPGRGWEIFFGVISLLAGVFVLAWPLETLPTLVVVVGIWLIVIGAFEIVSAFGIRSASKKVGTVPAAKPPAEGATP
jgi:uncharacterized membrane protein HdeD (DUF308 family)